MQILLIRLLTVPTDGSIYNLGSCAPFGAPFTSHSIFLPPTCRFDDATFTFLFTLYVYLCLCDLFRGGVFGQGMNNVFSIIERLDAPLPLFVIYDWDIGLELLLNICF